MKNKIKEVQNYFKTKILSGEFTIKQATEHVAVIQVDNQFSFSFWLANGADSCSQYTESMYSNFMTLNTALTKNPLYFAAIEPVYKKEIKAVLLTQKLKELQELQASINKIEA